MTGRRAFVWVRRIKTRRSPKQAVADRRRDERREERLRKVFVKDVPEDQWDWL
jgi:hypothetical protein